MLLRTGGKRDLQALTAKGLTWQISNKNPFLRNPHYLFFWKGRNKQDSRASLMAYATRDCFTKKFNPCSSWLSSEIQRKIMLGSDWWIGGSDCEDDGDRQQVPKVWIHKSSCGICWRGTRCVARQNIHYGMRKNKWGVNETHIRKNTQWSFIESFFAWKNKF